MQLHFESNLKYQEQAISSVVDVLKGNRFLKAGENILSEVVANNLSITLGEIQNNLSKVIQENLIESPNLTNELDFCVEMETGTGKTYVYLRTAFELFKQYGLSKFIIIVPSVPVKEGVLKTLEITKEHFKKLYNQEAVVIEYDSKKLSTVKNGFCYYNGLSIMVMNMQAFNSDDNIINQSRDISYGQPMIELIQKTMPIVIMDEPQEGMDSPNMIKRFEKLNPLFKLRYSATHKVLKNLIYKLTPFDAYNQGLVKKIEVLSIHKTNTQSNVHIELEGLKLSATKTPEAKLKLSHRLVGGDFKLKTTVCKRGDNLEVKTKNPIYKDWVIEQIQKDPFEEIEKVVFSGGQTITTGQHIGLDKEIIFREQIKRTIQAHYVKKAKLEAKNIKPLSLFFIDRVANYTTENGLIRQIFQEELKNYYQTKNWNTDNLHQLHEGYFAKTSSGEFTDNENSMQKNKEIYDLILKNKERLLSFEEPVEFIFSHSALGVGWDNPNVFTICTLNQSESQIKKRQEIGRGLRICVDQAGNRIRDNENTPEGKEINLLTVVANQSYYAFVSTYQQELLEEYGLNQAPKITNANQEPTQIRLNKDKLTSQDFQNLWSLLGKKSRCNVYFDQDKLITDSVVILSQIQTQATELEISRTAIDSISKEGMSDRYIGSTSSRMANQTLWIDVVSELARATTIPNHIVGEIITKISDKKEITKNPMQFISRAIVVLKNQLYEKLVSGVQYEITEDSYSLDQFEEIIQTKQSTTKTNKGLYDQIIFDSDIEKNFALELDAFNQVKIFVKLPNWYKIPTPIGSYNPDFALVLQTADLYDENNKQFYFAIETKGKKNLEELTLEEQLKIKCAIQHFEKLGLLCSDKQIFYEAPITNMAHLNQRTQENPKIQKALFTK